MKLLLIGAVAAALAQSTSAASCAISTLSNLLTNQYIDQCSADSGYVFTTGVKPVPAEVAGMCASDACHSLLADVVAMDLTDCTLPIGDKIYLFADLVDYVSDQCEDEEIPVPTTATPQPTTAAPTPAPTATTPAPTTAIASCTSTQLKYLLTSTYEKQCIADTGYPFTSPYSPTDAQVAAMCASESCVNLFAYVGSMVTTDCRIPVGGKILLLADLVYYVSDQCSPLTTVPTTTTPASTTAAPATPTATTATPVAACATKTITALLTDSYIDQCASDSGYAFTSGVQPDAEEVAGMCASSACANLLADVEAMGLSECSLPIGNKIYLFRDLVDYVSDQCSGSTTTAPSTTTTAPATAAPTTTTPASTTVAPTTETTAPAAEPPVTSASGSGSLNGESPSTDAPSTNSSSAASSATGSSATSTSGSESSSAELPSTSTPETESPSTSSPSTPSSSTNSSTTDDTPEPTAPTHEAC
ncbi:elicitin [Phytophthora sojae]|uniref:Elicitin n=2 Tax=Phytophthora sojae TaxID=67593 RepID=G4ZPJ8_PHYSP|nr:elicitin [Phytophthora sojae]ABB56024.1 elicitin-like protein SOL2C-D-E [Phytophthora sojae]EGZ16310.1 elicitin [Phytophthora sojae]|eukprot:XP_009530059.1 elicitin [Phytophthora sojae]